MVAGLLTVGATYGLTRRVYGEKPALFAAAMFALSPFAILFGPTAFTDPWLTFFLVAAAWAALARAARAGGRAGRPRRRKQAAGAVRRPADHRARRSHSPASPRREERGSGRPVRRARPGRAWLCARLRSRHLLGQPTLAQPAELLGSKPARVRRCGACGCIRAAPADRRLGRTALAVVRRMVADRPRAGRGAPGNGKASWDRGDKARRQRYAAI